MSEKLKFRLSMVDYDALPDRFHPLMTSSLHGTQTFCAYSHCRGECGQPALMLQYTGPRAEGPREFKAHGVMTACGPVWQQKPWEGEKVYMPAEYATDDMLDMWWH